MSVKDAKDFYAGLLFMLFGAAFMWGATQYSMGTAARMGAGYFPRLLGAILILLGLVIFLQGLTRRSADGRVGPWFFRPAILVFSAIAAFALLLRTAGLVVAIFSIVLISSLASREGRLVPALLSATVLCLACLAMFVYGLNIQIPVWPPSLWR
jgi:hypothetical protein